MSTMRRLRSRRGVVLLPIPAPVARVRRRRAPAESDAAAGWFLFAIVLGILIGLAIR